MFEECTSLGELNAARTKLLRDTRDESKVKEINNSYNAMRTKIIQARRPYTTVEMRKCPLPEQGPAFTNIPISGQSKELGVIEFDGKGFFI